MLVYRNFQFHHVHSVNPPPCIKIKTVLKGQFKIILLCPGNKSGESEQLEGLPKQGSKKGKENSCIQTTKNETRNKILEIIKKAKASSSSTPLPPSTLYHYN